MTEAYSTNHRLVTINLNWTSAGIIHQATMSTLISQYGLHNYYYHLNSL
jgi:hypothetical protein